MSELDPSFICPATKTPLKTIYHLHEFIHELLISTFNDRSDKIVEKILKDKTSFAQALKVSEDADNLNLHTSSLSSLRVKILDVLVGIIRDFDKARMISNHLQRDFDNGIQLSKEDDILYNTNLFLFSLIHNPDFDKGIIFGKKALALIESEPEMIEEKLRLFSNLIQYYSLTGLFDEAQAFVEKSAPYFQLSQSDAYNALYVLATTVFFNEQGKFEHVISLIKEQQPLLERQIAYPTMYSFTWIQLCEALIKKGDFEEAEKTLALTEKIGREFYAHENNTFFAKLFALQALIKFSKPEHFMLAKSLLKKSINIYDDIYCGSNKHKNQGSVHFFLSQLYFSNQQYNKARKHGLLSKKIYDDVLKSQNCFDVIELDKLLARLEVEGPISF
jgi:tetratricopeptide (TPR) repeat protein